MRAQERTRARASRVLFWWFNARKLGVLNILCRLYYTIYLYPSCVDICIYQYHYERFGSFSQRSVSAWFVWFAQGYYIEDLACHLSSCRCMFCTRKDHICALNNNICYNQNWLLYLERSRPDFSFNDYWLAEKIYNDIVNVLNKGKINTYYSHWRFSFNGLDT